MFPKVSGARHTRRTPGTPRHARAQRGHPRSFRASNARRTTSSALLYDAARAHFEAAFPERLEIPDASRNCRRRKPGYDHERRSAAPAGSGQCPTELQGLLRPVLVRALQDPTLMRQLGSTALSQHLMLLGHVLTSDPERAPSKAFVHLAAGHDVEDVEEVYRFARDLDAALQGQGRVLEASPGHVLIEPNVTTSAQEAGCR